MDILQEYKNLLKSQKQEQATILEIMKTGSQILKYSNNKPTDLDYLAICDNYTCGKVQGYYRTVVEIDEKKYDLIIQDVSFVKKRLNFDINHESLKYNYFLLDEYKENIYGNAEIDWNIFKYKTKYYNALVKIYNNTIKKKINKTSALKSYVHFYIYLKIFENNSTVYTDEMKRDVNIIYNGGEKAIPIIDWIREKMKNSIE